MSEVLSVDEISELMTLRSPNFSRVWWKHRKKQQADGVD